MLQEKVVQLLFGKSTPKPHSAARCLVSGRWFRWSVFDLHIFYRRPLVPLQIVRGWQNYRQYYQHLQTNINTFN